MIKIMILMTMTMVTMNMMVHARAIIVEEGGIEHSIRKPVYGERCAFAAVRAHNSTKLHCGHPDNVRV
eukprot:CAMPEP_0167779562 /NCGR_PEP_ID=MMETSP0111_2-20121227/4872_1 /TAXON_ID=91324 /ORGANISM="Lotharella globosa, Strain CCCM811" /LENGTH=67 /DNA_ID=CAMNT_0007669979 /DNA_START=193 /DNA_END=396 /DNA_ORIENTATION=-